MFNFKDNRKIRHINPVEEKIAKKKPKKKVVDPNIKDQSRGNKLSNEAKAAMEANAPLNAAAFSKFEPQAPSNQTYNPVYSRLNPKAIEEEALPSSAKQSSAVNQRFDLLKSRTNQEFNATRQRDQEALARKAAAQGGTGSGAFIKLGMQASDENDAARRDAAEGIEAERMGQLAALDEMDAQRQFARGERLGSQRFASQEADIGREFQSGETAAARGFERQLFDLSQSFQNKALAAENAQFLDSMAHAAEQLALDTKISAFNMSMAKKNGGGGGSNWENLLGDAKSWGGFYGEAWKAGERVGLPKINTKIF